MHAAPTIAAIPTVVEGIKYRSRLEARWAIFLRGLGIAFDYEAEGYDVLGEWYLPDFWLPEFNCFLEIKPGPDFDDNRARGLAEMTERPVLVGYRLPESEVQPFMQCIRLVVTDGGYGTERHDATHAMCDCGAMKFVGDGGAFQAHQGECSRTWLPYDDWFVRWEKAMDALDRAARWQFR